MQQGGKKSTMKKPDQKPEEGNHKKELYGKHRKDIYGKIGEMQ